MYAAKKTAAKAVMKSMDNKTVGKNMGIIESATSDPILREALKQRLANPEIKQEVEKGMRDKGDIAKLATALRGL